MNFNIETSRSQSLTATEKAKQIFSDQIDEKSDAIFTDGKRDYILAFSGLQYYAPVCMHIINDPDLFETISSYQRNLLIRKDEEISLYDETGNTEIRPG